jgi:hypothetical protein
MKVSSPAGDLDVAINGLKDFRLFLSVLFNPRIMLFIVRNIFFNPTK